MRLAATIRQTNYRFDSVKEVLAKANPLKSGDALESLKVLLGAAGVANLMSRPVGGGRAFAGRRDGVSRRAADGGDDWLRRRGQGLGSARRADHAATLGDQLRRGWFSGELAACQAAAEAFADAVIEVARTPVAR